MPLQLHHALDEPCGDAFRAFLGAITNGFHALPLNGSSMITVGDSDAGASSKAHACQQTPLHM